MGTLALQDRTVEYQWTSDVAFDGIRLEVLTAEGEMLFDVSVPDAGAVTINTFGREIASDLVRVALEVAERRQ